ncbi:MAG: hypothetical protein R3A47_10755 [Polyangiales bacterium]
MATHSVLVVSGHASVADAVQAVQLGATDYRGSRSSAERVLVSMRNALRTWQHERSRSFASERGQRYEMVGESQVMHALYAQIERSRPR